VDRGIGRLVGSPDHLRESVPQNILHPEDIVFAVIIILRKNSDLHVGMVLQDVFGIDPRLDPVAHPPTDRPRVLLVVRPFIGPACYEELWYLLLIDVFVDRRVARRAEWIEQERDAILLYQPSRLLDRLGRAVCVVIRDK